MEEEKSHVGCWIHDGDDYGDGDGDTDDDNVEDDGEDMNG